MSAQPAAPAMLGWSAPTALPPLGPDELHCWAASVALCTDHVHRWHALLSTDEHARRTALRMERDRTRFVITHAIKRLLLAHYTDVGTSELGFSSGAYGKPALSSLLAPQRALHFNLSHSGDLVLIAVADVPLGVDVEAWALGTSDGELDDMAVVAFSPLEREVMRTAPTTDRRRVFFDTWARKEAYIKATGDGVSAGLDHFDVSASVDDARLLADRHDSAAPDRWHMRALAVAPGYSGAIAWHASSAARARAVRLMQFVPALTL